MREPSHAYQRADPPPVTLMWPAAHSPGCREAPDGGSACRTGLEAALKASTEQVGGAPLAGASALMWWSEHEVEVANPRSAVPAEGGKRPPAKPTDAVIVHCHIPHPGDFGVLWLEGGRVRSRCGYDLAGWKDIVQIESESDTLCGLQRDGRVRCTAPTGEETRVVDGLVPGIEDAVEIALHDKQLCARTRTGDVQCVGHSLRPPFGPPSAIVLPNGDSLDHSIAGMTGATALDFEHGSLCVAIERTVLCSDGGPTFTSANPMRGMPPVARATTTSHGGIAIDQRGETVVWGWATDYTPKRSALRMAAVGGGLALDEAGSLMTWDGHTGTWLTVLPSLWPSPPPEIELNGSIYQGCAFTPSRAECWTGSSRQPAERTERESVRSYARPFEGPGRAFAGLADLVSSDGHAAVDGKGRLWLAGTDATPARPPYGEPTPWIPMEVEGGLPGDPPTLSFGPPPDKKGIAADLPSADVHFTRVDGYCARTKDGQAWCFGNRFAQGDYALRRVPQFDGFRAVSDDGSCALIDDEVHCWAKPPAPAIVLSTRVFFDPDGQPHDQWGSPTRSGGKVPKDALQVVRLQDHWASLGRNGIVRVVENDHPTYSDRAVFADLAYLESSEQIAGAGQRICGIREGAVRCVDSDQARVSRTVGTGWKVRGIDDARKIVMGGERGVGRTCVLHESGRVTCFGDLFVDDEGLVPIVEGLRKSVPYADEPPTDVGLESVSDIWLGALGGLVVVQHGRVVAYEMNWASQALGPACLPAMTSVGAGRVLGGCGADRDGDLWCWEGRNPRRIDLRGKTVHTVSDDGRWALTVDGDLLRLGRDVAALEQASFVSGEIERVALDAGCAWRAGEKPNCFGGPALPVKISALDGQVAVASDGAVWARSNGWAPCKWIGPDETVVSQPAGDVTLGPQGGFGQLIRVGKEPFVVMTGRCASKESNPLVARLIDGLEAEPGGDVGLGAARIKPSGELLLRLPTRCYGRGRTELAVRAD